MWRAVYRQSAIDRHRGNPRSRWGEKWAGVIVYGILFAVLSDQGGLDADDLTGGLVFLLSDHARFLAGQNLVIDNVFFP